MHQCEMACGLSALILAFWYEVHQLQVMLFPGKERVPVRDSTSGKEQGEPLPHRYLRMHLPLSELTIACYHQLELFRL